MAKRANKISPTTTLDLGYLRAATVLAKVPAVAPIGIYLVGCGGTGSYLALHLGRLLRALKDAGRATRAFFIDHDTVEAANIGRQLFCEAELGLNKAEALALRYGTAWGVQIAAIPERFETKMIRNRASDDGEIADGLSVIVGCVDNAAARRVMASALRLNRNYSAPDVWWLDCGNHEETGQVLLGSARTRDDLFFRPPFSSEKVCQALPAPSLQRPDLLKARPHETKKRLSCAELAAANLQSLNINSRIAGEAADMLTRLLLTRDLKRFACELNLAAGSMRSIYATPETVRAAIG